MSYKIDCSKCVGCQTCLSVCPMGAIIVNPQGKCEIDETKCVSCGTCAGVCPLGVISSN